MTLLSHLSVTILSASIDHIAPLLMAGAQGDQQAARDAVTALLADYRPQTNEELTLAADIVYYRFLAIDTLARSVEPELSLTKVLRLRGSAVSLSREVHKTQRKLDKLQSNPAAATLERPASEPSMQPEPAPHVESSQPAPPTQAELAAVHAARAILNGEKPIAAGACRGPEAAQNLRKRLLVQTMKENAARAAARRAAEPTAQVA